MSISNGACIFQLADKTVHGKSGMSVTLLPGQTSINSIVAINLMKLSMEKVGSMPVTLLEGQTSINSIVAT